jgi:diacylglycerol O-acyltransferase / wax synthase
MRRLSALDTQMLYLESPRTPNHVAAIWTCDPTTAPNGQVSFEDALERVRSRLHMARAFRERIAAVPLNLDNPYWIRDPDFDLEFHVRHIRLPKPGDWRQFCILLARLYAHPLDLSRPPWELYFVEGLDNIPHLPEGSFATLLKVHHAAVDGVAGLEMTSALNDTEPDPAPIDPPAEPWVPDRLPSSKWLLRRGLVNNLQSPARIVGATGNLVPAFARVAGGLRRREFSLPPRGAPQTRFNGPVTPHRVIECRRFALSDVKLVRAAVPGATVNDVIITIVGGAVRQYLESKAELPDAPLITIMPISVRSPGTAGDAGNQFSMMPVTTASDIADPVERLNAVRESTSGMKQLAAAVGAHTLIDIAQAMPGALLGLTARFTALNRTGGVNLTVTNVPGPQTPLYFCGARCVDAVGAGPFADRLGLIHLVGSYDGYLFCSVTADRDMMPDPAFYAQCLDDSFAALILAVGAEDALDAQSPWP